MIRFPALVFRASSVALLALAIRLPCSAAESPPPVAVVFVLDKPAGSAPAPFATAVSRIIRHCTIELSRGRIVDVTAWRPPSRADAVITVRAGAAGIECRVLRHGQQKPVAGSGHVFVIDSSRPAEVVARAYEAGSRAVQLLIGGNLPPGKESAPEPSPCTLPGRERDVFRAASAVPAEALAELDASLSASSESGAAAGISRRLHAARAAQLAPDWPLAHLELGRAIAAEGDGAGAIAPLLRAAELDPADPEVLSELALAYRRTGRLADAISSYTRALALTPADPLLHNNLGVALLASDERDGAVRHFRTAAALEPAYPEPWVNLGTVHRAAGEDREAEKDYRHAVELGGTEPGPRIALARLFSDAGDPRAAQEILEPAAAAYPCHAAVQFQFALVLATRQKYAAAIERLHAVLRLEPAYREARYNLGLCYHYTGRDREAIPVFEEGVRRDPNYAWNYYGLGIAYETRGQSGLAEEAFKMAVEKAPDFELAKIALKRVRGELDQPKLAWPFGAWCAESKADAHAAGPLAAGLPSIITLGGLLLPAVAIRIARRRRRRK